MSQTDLKETESQIQKPIPLTLKNYHKFFISEDLNPLKAQAWETTPTQKSILFIIWLDLIEGCHKLKNQNIKINISKLGSHPQVSRKRLHPKAKRVKVPQDTVHWTGFNNVLNVSPGLLWGDLATSEKWSKSKKKMLDFFLETINVKSTA